MEQNEANNTEVNFTEYLTEILTENIIDDFSNSTENVTDNNNDESLISGSALTEGFLFFVILALYIIFKLNSFGYNQEQKNNVWYFLYMANNGTLIANGINILNIFDRNSDVLGEILNYGHCAMTSIIFFVGLCILLCKIKYSFSFFEPLFQFDTLCYLFGLIKFMWSLLGLTDPCCRINTITVTVYVDGHTEDNSCCVCIWNTFIYFLKRLSYVYSVIAFIIFFIFYFFIFIIAKLIYLLMINTCLKIKFQEYNENKQNVVNNNLQKLEHISNIQNNCINHPQNPGIISPILNNNIKSNFINNGQIIIPTQNNNLAPVINVQNGNVQIKNNNNSTNNNNFNEEKKLKKIDKRTKQKKSI